MPKINLINSTHSIETIKKVEIIVDYCCKYTQSKELSKKKPWQEPLGCCQGNIKQDPSECGKRLNFAAEILTKESRTIPEGEEFPDALTSRQQVQSMVCRGKYKPNGLEILHGCDAPLNGRCARVTQLT